MKTPWNEIPHLPQGAGWRMGDGAAYVDEFYIWFSRLETEARQEFINTNPEPTDWSGFYQNMIDNPAG